MFHPATQNVSAIDGNATFTITCNEAWTAISDATWCTVTPSGFGDGIVTATYDANPGSAPRTAHITVSAAGVTPVEVQLIQDGTVGISEKSETTFRISPNPARDQVKISLKASTAGTAVISMVDLTGKDRA